MYQWALGVICGFLSGMFVTFAAQEVRRMILIRRQPEVLNDWGGDLTPDEDAKRILEGYAITENEHYGVASSTQELAIVEPPVQDSRNRAPRHGLSAPDAIPVLTLLASLASAPESGNEPEPSFRPGRRQRVRKTITRQREVALS